MKTRFTQAAIDRQTALDYIIANPGAYGPDIVAATGLDGSTNAKSVGSDRLRDMAEHGEVSRTPVIIEIVTKQGYTAKIRTYTYTALKTKTRSEADAKRRMVANLASTKDVEIDEDDEPEIDDGPEVAWRLVHRPDKPIRNQGGQGNRRHEIRRGCSLS